MIRPLTTFLLATGLVVASTPGFAQTAGTPAPRHVRKATRSASRPAASPGAPASINTPSTDFSTVERADDDAAPGGAGGGNVRPVMGAGGHIGLGTGF